MESNQSVNHFVINYGKQLSLTPKEKVELKSYLKTAITKKKLQRAKDVVYDASSGKIKSIPGLSYDKKKNRFTLRRIDKKNSTLKGLAQKKKHKTKRKKGKIANEKKKKPVKEKRNSPSKNTKK